MGIYEAIREQFVVLEPGVKITSVIEELPGVSRLDFSTKNLCQRTKHYHPPHLDNLEGLLDNLCAAQISQVVSVDISQNVLGKEGVQMVAHSLSQFSPTLVSLSLASNDLFNEGARLILSGLQKAEAQSTLNLQELDLRYNGIGRAEKEALLAFCSSRNISLRI